jgi:hypothetical protein
VPKGTITALLACLALTACGGEGNGDEAEGGSSSEAETETEARAESDKTFEGAGYSFNYPAHWKEQHPVVGSGTGTPTAETYIGLDKTNVLGVVVGPGGVSITEANLADYEIDFAATVGEQFILNGGQMTKGAIRAPVNGLPGLAFEGWLINPDGVRVESRPSFIFDGTTQYFMNCQFTAEHAEEMKQGCQQVKESFQVAQ